MRQTNSVILLAVLQWLTGCADTRPNCEHADAFGHCKQ